MAKEEVVLPTENNKPAWLQEVEEDARYITEKRFADQQEQNKRDQEKKARDAAKKEA
jgi:hypothetical protein